MTDCNLAIQLYSVREALKADFSGTLAQLQEIGFTGVELAFYYGGLNPAELAATLQKFSLRPCGIYESAAKLQDPQADVYQYAKALGCQYLTLGFGPDKIKQDCDGCLRELQQAVQVAAGHGCKICYHAHSHEFARVGGRSYLERLLEETPGVLYEADTAWIHAGGEAVVPHLRKYAPMIPLLHLKDLTAAGRITELGHGVLDFDAVLAVVASTDIGTMSYEQDSSDIGALASARISYEFIKSRMARAGLARPGV
ncbi:MAG: sugar phosphate isomerase/epimerase [Oligosphaeraceae bacterium]|nr:sugar phosphate isomerase/epimerase [Oligosphaeraceae bacterium]